MPFACQAAEESAIPRTEHGFPDLQGVWTNATATALERSPQFADKPFLTEDEATALENGRQGFIDRLQSPLAPDRPAPPVGDTIGQQADINFITLAARLARIDGRIPSSLIVEPPDGRLPLRDGVRGRFYNSDLIDAGHGEFDGPEIRPASERCLSVFDYLPPSRPLAFNSNFQIVQTQDHVMLLAEMAHDARIIPLGVDGSPFDYPRWMGNSVGYWEGDTLVVQTSNFRSEQHDSMVPMSQLMQVTERFTRVSETEIHYSYTAFDPSLYTQPFTVEMPLVQRADGEHLYEFACHEGNYSLPSVLAGARRHEVDAAGR